MRHIMVATDGSKGADRAVDAAAGLAKISGGKLFIVTVAEALSPGEIRELELANKNIDDALEGILMQILVAAEKRAQRLGLTDIQLQISWGDVAKSIIEIAAREAVDVIVLGRRGRSELIGLLLGSVSQQVASLAACTVIIVP
jgi:nucleotide-binding universal stress UspA family protein